MGTVVTIQVLADGPDVAAAVDRAFGWFREIESRWTRFDPESEHSLLFLLNRAGKAIRDLEVAQRRGTSGSTTTSS
jgi:hypothetical protein